MVRGLSVLDDYLDYPQVFAETKGWLPSQVLEAPLAPDMLSFGDQVAVLCNKVDAHVAELLRRNVPLPHEAERNYPASKARLAEPIRFLDGLLAEDLAGAENHTFELSPRSCVDGSAGPITYSNSSCRISFSTSLQHDILPLRVREDLRRYQLIHDTSMAAEPESRTWRDWYERAGLPVTESDRGLHINDSAGAFRAAIAGQGVPLGRTTLVEQDVAEGRLVQPFGPMLECPLAYYVVCRKQDADDPEWPFVIGCATRLPARRTWPMPADRLCGPEKIAATRVQRRRHPCSCLGLMTSPRRRG
jgi:hypothetical protein